MSVVEYKRKFGNLSKYSQEKLTSKVEMYTQFEWGLNENIEAMLGALDIKEFLVLSERTQKMDAIWSEKK